MAMSPKTVRYRICRHPLLRSFRSQHVQRARLIQNASHCAATTLCWMPKRTALPSSMDRPMSPAVSKPLVNAPILSVWEVPSGAVIVTLISISIFGVLPVWLCRFWTPRPHDRLPTGAHFAGDGGNCIAVSDPFTDQRLLISRKGWWTPECFALRFRTCQSGLGALDQKISLELGNRVDHTHRQLARRTGQIYATQRGTDINRVAPQPVQLGHDNMFVRPTAQERLIEQTCWWILWPKKSSTPKSWHRYLVST